MSNKTLLEDFIKYAILESKDPEAEIMDDFLNSNMYKKIAKLIESSHIKISESKSDKEIVSNPKQINKIHKSLEEFFGDVESSVELNKKIEALAELNRAKSNEDFHQRKADINKFLNKVGVTLEAAPFFFVLIYLFNTNNTILQTWCQSNNITLTNSLVSFLAMFLFGKMLRSGRKKEIRINQDAADLYKKRKEDAGDNLKSLEV